MVSDGEQDVTGASAQVHSARDAAIAWAASVSQDLLQCLQAPSRLQLDYSVCLTMYLVQTTGKAPNAYFTYVPQSSTSKEPPDACKVYTGLNASASFGAPLQKQMNDCIMSAEQSNVVDCRLSPILWSSSSSPVAKLHGTVPSHDTQHKQQVYYDTIVNDVQTAFNEMWSKFNTEAPKVEAILFSADGDFIHDLLDCVFMGPYSRVEMLPCDAGGLTDCPYYSRDPNSGMSRNFTSCGTEELEGDDDLPFTCGSPARRALIKYFYRNYSHLLDGNSGLQQNVTELMRKRLKELEANYTNTSSYGCYDPSTGSCRPEACSAANGFTPCTDLRLEMSSMDMTKMLMTMLMESLQNYYQTALQA